MTSYLNGCPHFFCVSLYFFLKLIVTCRLCAIYVREDDNSNLEVMITWFPWITWTSLSAVGKKLLNLIVHSFLHSPLDIAGGKHYQKVTIHISRLVLQNVALSGCFPCILCYPIVFPTFFWLVCYCSMSPCFSPGNWLSLSIIVNWELPFQVTT